MKDDVGNVVFLMIADVVVDVDAHDDDETRKLADRRAAVLANRLNIILLILYIYIYC